MDCTCTECGTTATAERAALLVAMNWQIDVEGGCLCPICARREYLKRVVSAARAMRNEATAMRARIEAQLIDVRSRARRS